MNGLSLIVLPPRGSSHRLSVCNQFCYMRYGRLLVNFHWILWSLPQRFLDFHSAKKGFSRPIFDYHWLTGLYIFLDISGSFLFYFKENLFQRREWTLKEKACLAVAEPTESHQSLQIWWRCICRKAALKPCMNKWIWCFLSAAPWIETRYELEAHACSLNSSQRWFCVGLWLWFQLKTPHRFTFW